MNKFWLVFEREYMTRVKKPSFILVTILAPLSIGAFALIVGLIFAYNSQTQQRSIIVLDEGKMLASTMEMSDTSVAGKLTFDFLDISTDSAKALVKAEKYDGVLVVPAMKSIDSTSHLVKYYAEDQLGLEMGDRISDKIGDGIRDFKISTLHLDKRQLETLSTDVEIDPEPLTAGGEDASPMTTYIAAAIGGSLGFIMYLTVFIYGMMVMRSVMEEKVNRVVEIIVSSVKPFQLMLGKIIGVGAVGLTQVAIWAILLPVIMFFVQLVIGTDTQSIQAAQMGAPEMPAQLSMMNQLWAELAHQQWWLILPLFVFFFLGGYILYASLFAALGSAINEDMGESQTLTIPVTIPVVLAFYIMMASINAPHSGLAVFGSLFPLFSPIVMPARLPFHPPIWQVLLSVLLLVGTCIFFVWLSGRIYRVGILMYGKKVTLKEISKWMFYKG